MRQQQLALDRVLRRLPLVAIAAPLLPLRPLVSLVVLVARAEHVPQADDGARLELLLRGGVEHHLSVVEDRDRAPREHPSQRHARVQQRDARRVQRGAQQRTVVVDDLQHERERGARVERAEGGVLHRAAEQRLRLALARAGQPAARAEEHLDRRGVRELARAARLARAVDGGEELGALVREARRAVGAAERAGSGGERADLVGKAAVGAWHRPG
mmetsp:Transcript_23661/g.50117  ORF Transcript_23661/g.50117 Transcript_23661/m.50117 type:complete len:215 (+) Transcript_23661:521-1165(+)